MQINALLRFFATIKIDDKKENETQKYRKIIMI